MLGPVIFLGDVIPKVENALRHITLTTTRHFHVNPYIRESDIHVRQIKHSKITSS